MSKEANETQDTARVADLLGVKQGLACAAPWSGDRRAANQHSSNRYVTWTDHAWFQDSLLFGARTWRKARS